MSNRSEVTVLLESWQHGDPEALDRLLPIVYEQLRRLASRQFEREESGLTLQPTALVHEVYLKLMGQDPGRVENRTHFFALAAKVMRQVLVDNARRRGAEKRGGGRRRVTLADAFAETSEGADAGIDPLDLDAALQRLAAIQPRAARVVELRYFGGLTLDETAKILEVAPKTVSRDWTTARLWLLDRLEPADLERPAGSS